MDLGFKKENSGSDITEFQSLHAHLNLNKDSMGSILEVIISSGILGRATVDGGLVVSGSGHAQNYTTSLQDIFDVAMMIFKGAVPR